MGKILITNNELMNEAMSGKSIFDEVVFHSGTCVDVLTKAKGYIAGGCRLLTSPGVGSLPVHEMPFRTLILEDAGEVVDFTSLNVINRAIKKVEQAVMLRPRSLWNHTDLADFRKNDLVLIERWLIKIYYKNYWGNYGKGE